MAQVNNKQTIEVWPATAPGQPDPTTHFWYYQALDDRYRRVCDDVGWPFDTPLISDESRVYIPCLECRGLYVEDIVHGEQRLQPISYVADPLTSVSNPPKLGEYPPSEKGNRMEIATVAIATFARFYEATEAMKVRMVRDARLIQANPDGYKGRDYYRDFRNTLRQTHWTTDDITTFEAALDGLVKKQNIATRAESYRTLGDAYVRYFKKRDTHVFQIDPVLIDLAGLTIRVNSDVLMTYNGDDMALKFSFNAPKPARAFRQVIQHLTQQALDMKQQPKLQPLILDVRREELLPQVKIPKDFQYSVEGQAGAFKQIWASLDKKSRDDEDFGFE